MIPVTLRRRLHLVEGESQVILRVEDDGGLRITTREQALAKIRAEIRKHVPTSVSLADELLADRRREAAEEDAGE